MFRWHGSREKWVLNISALLDFFKTFWASDSLIRVVASDKFLDNGGACKYRWRWLKPTPPKWSTFYCSDTWRSDQPLKSQLVKKSTQTKTSHKDLLTFDIFGKLTFLMLTISLSITCLHSCLRLGWKCILLVNVAYYMTALIAAVLCFIVPPYFWF